MHSKAEIHIVPLAGLEACSTPLNERAYYLPTCLNRQRMLRLSAALRLRRASATSCSHTRASSSTAAQQRRCSLRAGDVYEALRVWILTLTQRESRSGADAVPMMCKAGLLAAVASDPMGDEGSMSLLTGWLAGWLAAKRDHTRQGYCLLACSRE